MTSDQPLTPDQWGFEFFCENISIEEVRVLANNLRIKAQRLFEHDISDPIVSVVEPSTLKTSVLFSGLTENEAKCFEREVLLRGEKLASRPECKTKSPEQIGGKELRQ